VTSAKHLNRLALRPAARINRRFVRPARSALPVLIYLIGFVIVLAIVSHYYLFPAIEATRGADHKQREMLAGHATLVLIIVLFVLFTGLLITFRIGRSRRAPDDRKAEPTKYVDAWEESGRRLKLPDREETQD